MRACGSCGRGLTQRRRGAGERLRIARIALMGDGGRELRITRISRTGDGRRGTGDGRRGSSEWGVVSGERDLTQRRGGVEGGT